MALLLFYLWEGVIQKVLMCLGGQDKNVSNIKENTPGPPMTLYMKGPYKVQGDLIQVIHFVPRSTKGRGRTVPSDLETIHSTEFYFGRSLGISMEDQKTLKLMI